MSAGELLGRLLTQPPPCTAGDDLEAWWRSVAPLRAGAPTPIDAAALCGWASDRIGFAFAGGYAAALQRLLPGLPDDRPTALCATEEGGAHPRAIKTRLEVAADGSATLDGHKRWVTLGAAARKLLVLATAGVAPDGRQRLELVRVDAAAPGVRIVPQPPMAFVPEIAHAGVVFEHAAVEERLPGDGWERWVKPFRTVEDLHVHGALYGYLLGVAARHAWPAAVRESLAAGMVGLRALALDDPASAAVHVALAGVFGASRRHMDELDSLWRDVDSAERARFERDRPLLEVAGRARAARRERAWSRFSPAREGDTAAPEPE